MTQNAERILEVEGLGISYIVDSEVREIAAEMSFAALRGEFIALVGPSGVGKTSLVRCIAGLQRPTDGVVRLRGAAVTGGPPEALAFVSQDYSRSLLPWMRIFDNVALPLRSKGLSTQTIRDRVTSSLHAVGLSSVARSYPWQLSGGMQQRVSIARALAYEPELLIMDEPFASVDAQTRAELEDLVISIQKATKVSILLITHDIDSAVYMADRVLVLGGRPASILREVPVRLGDTRDQLTTKSSPEFLEDRAEVLLSVQDAQRMLATPETTEGTDA